MLTIKSPSPLQTFQVGTTTITTDAHGLVTVAAGSDVAKALISYGWTVIAALPAVDPHVAGAVWDNAGTLAISAG
jgi:hypothetical protein